MAIDGSRVVFVAEHDSAGENGDGSIEIFSATPGGQDLRQHSHYAAATADDPHVSADGGRIVFSASGDLDGDNDDGSAEIFGIGADGTGLVRLTSTLAPEFCRTSAISPDGQWVAFASNADLVPGTNPDGNEEIFRVRFDGTELSQITDTMSGASRRPRMSTDGRRMVFISTADILSGANMGDGRVAFWREATGVFQLLTPPSDRPIDALHFSHDGTRLALLSTGSMEGRNPTHAIRIFATATDGTLLRSITVPGGMQAQGLAFSADGAWFGAADATGQILIIPWAGGEIDTVMSLPGVVAGYPSVNSDGSRLSFVSLGSSSGFRAGDIYLFDRGSPPEAEGLLGHTQSLPTTPPALSANGQTVAFQMTGVDSLNLDGSREIFAARLPTTAVTWLELAASGEGQAIRIRWRAAADREHAGFRVARAPESSGPWETLSGPIDRSGEWYEWRDTAPSDANPWYRVEAVDRHGRRSSSAP
ncbi:MAG: WD40 domain protein beta Propeller, partial [bacterium]